MFLSGIMIWFGIYYPFLFFIFLGLLTIVSIIWSRRNARRSQLQWQRWLAEWEEALRVTNELTLDDARRQLLPLLADPALLIMVPATGVKESVAGYPPALQELFAQYDTIFIEDNFAIGTVLPPMPFRSAAAEDFIVPAPYRLVGYDILFDVDGIPLVIKGSENTLYLLETFDEPDPGERYVAPSVIHFLLARARFRQTRM